MNWNVNQRMIMQTVKTIIVSLILLIPISLSAQSFITEEGYVEFTSSVPLHSFKGSSNHLNGLIDLDENLVDFYIDLQTLDTGNGKRDRDMYSTLNVEEHPFAEFTGSLTSSFNPEASEEQEVTVSGDFSIHGVTQAVDISGTLQNVENGLLLNASWILNLDDYQIEPPGILFYKVDEEIEVKIEAELQPQVNE